MENEKSPLNDGLLDRQPIKQKKGQEAPPVGNQLPKQPDPEKASKGGLNFTIK